MYISFSFSTTFFPSTESLQNYSHYFTIFIQHLLVIISHLKKFCNPTYLLVLSFFSLFLSQSLNKLCLPILLPNVPPGHYNLATNTSTIKTNCSIKVNMNPFLIKINGWFSVFIFNFTAEFEIIGNSLLCATLHLAFRTPPALHFTPMSSVPPLKL